MNDPWKLLEIAESAKPPDEQPQGEDWCANVTLRGKDGWKIVFFYDCGELDYIDSFISPDGNEIDFWEWPEKTYGRDLLIAWRGVGDLESLKRIV